jgi:hypothetical protein
MTENATTGIAEKMQNVIYHPGTGTVIPLGDGTMVLRENTEFIEALRNGEPDARQRALSAGSPFNEQVVIDNLP